MKVKIEFDEDHLLKVTTDQGEELRGYRYEGLPPLRKEDETDLFEWIRIAFENSDNLAEVNAFIQNTPNPRLMGLVFQYIVPPSVARRRNIGAKIKALRESNGYTLREFAFRLQMDPSNYSRIETGKHAVSIDTLNRICYYLDADVQIVPKEIDEQKKRRYKYSRIMHYE